MGLQNTSLPYVRERCRPMGLFHTGRSNSPRLSAFAALEPYFITTRTFVATVGALIPIPDIGMGLLAPFC